MMPKIAWYCHDCGIGGAQQWQRTLIHHARTVQHIGIDSLHGIPEQLHQVEAEFLQDVDLIVAWGRNDLDVLAGKRVCHVSHCTPGLGEWAMALGGQPATHRAAVCESAAAIFPDDQPVEIVHNGADIERCLPVFGREWQRDEWRIPQDAKVALYLGRMSPEKGVLELVKSIKELPEEWYIVMIGSGSVRGILDSLPHPRIHVLPCVEYPGDAYAGSDVVVIPGKCEAFPLVMIEAWHAQRPVVVATLSVFVDSMLLSILTKKVDIDLAGSILSASYTPELDESLEYYSASAMVGRWERYWHSILDASAPVRL